MSKESKPNTRVIEVLRTLLKAEDKPMQSPEIATKLKAQGYKYSTERIRYYLYYHTQKGYLVKYKIDGIPTFYCLPEWFTKKGVLTKEINHINTK